LFMVTTNYAQSSASVSGIAVQGIARDNNNTAMASASITLNFEIYYKNPSDQSVFTENKTLSTDAFGVFSHVLNVDPTTISSFANNILYLRIKNGTTIISDETFKHVPYAIAANNGVPTGSIMPYIGTTAPPGWVLCNGQPLNVIAGTANLITLVGPNAPNLQGMFLRGTGTSSVNGQDGPNLMATQGDGFKLHNHTGLTTINGTHTHDTEVPDTSHNSGIGVVYNGGPFAYRWNFTGATTSTSDGNHQHTIPNDGINETRPVNYGVNYIIKL